jgi:hypothetical protein
MIKITLLSLFVLAGCGGSAQLTCEYLEDPQNCWAQAAAAAKACLPADADSGVLAADRASCSFSDGTQVVFDDPLPNDIMDLESFGFTIEKSDGSKCASFLDTFENRMELEAGGNKVISQLRAKFELICGDGKTYRSDFDLLFECAAGSQPTDGFEVTPDLVYFMIISVTTPGELFRCTPSS